LALPNLIVIGAMKCATTALHRYLDAHPDIAMAAPKEMNFFVGAADRDDGWHRGNWHRGLDWYAAQFPDAPVRGEASPSYTSPSFPDAAERMARVIPDARLILLVRDPVDRAISQYRHHRAEGTERRPLDEALLDPASQYLDRSRYHACLAPYLERFPREHIAVCLQEDLLARRRETVARIYRFAGVDDAFWSAQIDRLFHVGGQRGPMQDPALEARLVAALADDVQRLRTLTGRDLGEWPRFAKR
jgi:hypothetical protein